MNPFGKIPWTLGPLKCNEILFILETTFLGMVFYFILFSISSFKKNIIN